MNGDASAPPGYEAFDQLATMVAVASPEGQCLLANSTLENVMGQSRRSLQRGSVFDWLVDPTALRETVAQVARNQVTSGRFDAALRRAGVPGVGGGELPVFQTVVEQLTTAGS